MRFSQYPPLLGDTSIRVKVLIPPAILILALTVVSLLAVYGLGVQRAALGQVHDIALEKIALVDEFAILSEQVQSDVFHISVLRFMNLPEGEIQPIYQRLEQGLNDLNVIYGQMLTRWPLDEAEQSILERMKGPMDDFHHQAEQAVAVVSDNPSFGVLLVRSSTVPFTEFRNTLTEFLAYQETSIVRTEARSYQRTNTIGVFIIAITLAIALIGTFATTLIGTRLISHPIRSMTDLMRRLADGDLSIKVEGIERQDEIGAMAQAIEVFRQNATEKAQAEEALQQRTAQLESLRKIGLELAAQLDLDTLLHSIASRAVELLGGIGGGLYLYRPDRDVLEWIVPIGPTVSSIGTILHRGEGLSGRVLETGEPIIVDDYRHWEGRSDAWEGYPFTAIVGVPVHWGEEFLGVLNVHTDAPVTFSPADAELLNLFAAQAAIAIRNVQLYEQTQQDAETKATLLDEVNHRVGNNLTALIGILAIEQDRSNVDQVTYQAVMEDLINRVRGLAMVHQMLSAAEWSPLLLSELAERIIALALRALPSNKHASMKVTPSSVRVIPKYANNLALIFNELTTNSIKYAWTNRQSGHIAVRIDRQEDMVVIEFRDDGAGYPAEVLRLEQYSIGWDLIQSIVAYNMQGEINLHNDQGAVTTIRFPVSG